VTPAWSYTLPLGRSDLLIDGYIDWVVNNRDASDGRRGQADYHANLHINPQVKYDLGKALGHEPSTCMSASSTTIGRTSTASRTARASGPTRTR
jgi:nucleoside-specific outer membrane channel protein Tsx